MVCSFSYCVNKQWLIDDFCTPEQKRMVTRMPKIICVCP